VLSSLCRSIRHLLTVLLDLRPHLLGARRALRAQHPRMEIQDHPHSGRPERTQEQDAHVPSGGEGNARTRLVARACREGALPFAEAARSAGRAWPTKEGRLATVCCDGLGTVVSA
jgi:hypothetical protein